MDCIFSTYKQGENRVTSSILAVLSSLSLPLVDRILGALMEESTFQSVRFDNQSKLSIGSIPDASISSSLEILLETKIIQNTVRQKQLEQHLARLLASQASCKRLLVLTPDIVEPAIITNLKVSSREASEFVLWCTFVGLDQAINALLDDKSLIVSDREAFLLRELQKLLDMEGLLGSPFNVVVVAARDAWGEYNNYNAYICQADRSFKDVDYIAFYKDGEIKPFIPRILEKHSSVTLGDYEGMSDQLRKLTEKLLKDGVRNEGDSHQIFLLSDENSTETVNLNHSIKNDLSSDKRAIAYTQGQRYAHLDDLKSARTTSELVDMANNRKGGLLTT